MTTACFRAEISIFHNIQNTFRNAICGSPKRLPLTRW
uniref:Uncharacterized protein n=1 Tax=Anguilla anguilla TaxID=7936 RepID=A0A0E9V760_ANGAN